MDQSQSQALPILQCHPSYCFLRDIGYIPYKKGDFLSFLSPNIIGDILDMVPSARGSQACQRPLDDPTYVERLDIRSTTGVGLDAKLFPTMSIYRTLGRPNQPVSPPRPCLRRPIVLLLRLACRSLGGPSGLFFLLGFLKFSHGLPLCYEAVVVGALAAEDQHSMNL